MHASKELRFFVMDIYLFNCTTLWMSGKCFCINNENIVLNARKSTNNQTQVDNLTPLSNNVFIFKLYLYILLMT